MLQIKFTLGRCLSMDSITALEIAKRVQSRKDAQIAAIHDTQIIITQDQKDVKLFIKLVCEANDGISEYQIQNILKFSVRRYERARRNSMSFCMGALVWNNRSKHRKFYYHNNTIKVLQEKLI